MGKGHSAPSVKIFVHCGKAWMAESLMASFVAVFAKTAYPTYIEKHHKQ
jgi:hypothetical protein